MDKTNQDGLRIIAAPTDRRAYDDWAYDDDFCHHFLLHISNTHPDHHGRAAKWDRAIKWYWRGRCSRRELADELQIGIDAAKSLITLIRKAAEKFKADGHAGFKSTSTGSSSWNGRVHATITAKDVGRIIEGDREAIAHAEEYHRLSIHNQLTFFDSKISDALIAILNESDALDKTDSQAAADLITKANALKKSVGKDDVFWGRPLIQNFTVPQPNYHEDRRGRPRKSVQPTAATGPTQYPMPARSNSFLVAGQTNNFNDNTEAA